MTERDEIAAVARRGEHEHPAGLLGKRVDAAEERIRDARRDRDRRVRWRGRELRRLGAELEQRERIPGCGTVEPVDRVGREWPYRFALEQLCGRLPIEPAEPEELLAPEPGATTVSPRVAPEASTRAMPTGSYQEGGDDQSRDEAEERTVSGPDT